MQNEDSQMQKKRNLWHWVHWPILHSWKDHFRQPTAGRRYRE